MLVLTAKDINDAISIPEAIQALSDFFLALAKHKVMMPPRHIISMNDQDMALFMPCYVQQPPALGIKIASLMPQNIQKNLPLIHGLVILMDPETGSIMALMDGAVITALRTGSVCALASKLLAKPESSTLLMIGTGVQARSILNAICHVYTIKTVYLYSRSQTSMTRFKQDMTAYNRVPTDIQCISEPAKFAPLADIICTATSTTSSLPFIHLKDVKEGTHINSIGGSSDDALEIDPHLLKYAKVVVDQKAVVLRESPEIQSAIKNNFIQANNIIELADVVSNKITISRNETSYFRADGMALEDLAVANLIYQNALKRGLGSIITL